MSTINTQGPDIAGITNLNKQQALLGVYDEEQPVKVEDQGEVETIQLEVPPVSPKAEVEQEQETVPEVPAVEEVTVVENVVEESENTNQEVEAEPKPEEEVAEISNEGAGIEDSVAEGKDDESEVVSKSTIKADREVRKLEPSIRPCILNKGSIEDPGPQYWMLGVHLTVYLNKGPLSNP